MTNMDHPERNLELPQLYQGKNLLLSKFTSSTYSKEGHLFSNHSLTSFSFSLFLSLSGPFSKRWSAWTRWLCRLWTRLKNLSALTGFYFLLLDLQGEFWEIRTFPTQSFSVPCWLEDEPAVRQVIWGQEVQTWFCKRNVTRCWLWRIFDVSCDEDSGEMKQGDNAMRWHPSICTRFVRQHINPLF